MKWGIAAVFLSMASVVLAQSSLPDAGNTLTIAGAVMPWGSLFVLNGSQAQSQRDNRCAFAFSYELNNLSDQSIAVSATSVMVDAKMLHLGQPVLLPARNKKNISGRLYLPNGTSQLQFSVETAQGVVNKTVAVQLSGC